MTPDSASSSLLLFPSPSSSSRPPPFLTGLGQEFRTWTLIVFHGQREECLSLTLQEGEAVSKTKPQLSRESHFDAYREIWKAPGSRPAAAGPAGPQPKTHQSLLPGTALPGKPSQALQSKPPSAGGGKEPEEKGRHLLPSVRLWGNP